MPEKLRLAQLCGQPLVGGEVGVDAADVAELEPVAEPIDVRAHLQLEIPAPLRQLVHLARLAQATLRLGEPDAARDLAAHEGEGQRRGVVDAARHLHRFEPELVGAAGRIDPVQPGGESAEQLSAQRRVLLADRLERLLEQLDQRVVDDARLGQQADLQHRPRQVLRPVQAPRQLRGALQCRARLADLGGAALRRPELEQQLEPALEVVVRAELEGLQRPLVEPGGVLVRHSLGRSRRGADRVLDRAIGVAGRAGLEVMMGEPAEVIVDLAGVHRLDRRGAVAMDRRAPRGRHLGVQGLADQRVSEGVLAGAFARLDDQPCVDRFAERRRHLFRRAVADPRDHLELELPTADGGEPQHLVGGLREAIEPPADHLAHALRDRDLPPRLVLAEATLGRHQPHDLADEERVAPRLLADRDGELGGRAIDAGGELDVAGDSVGVEAVQCDSTRGVDLGELAERCGKRVVAAELDVAVGADDQQAGVGEPAGEEAQQQQRRLVGPVQIVEHDDQRAGARGAAEELGDGVEDPEARLLGIHRRELADVAEALADLGHDPRHVRGAGAELPAQPDRIGLADVLADRLRPWPVRRGAVALVAATPEHARSAHPGVGRELLGGPGLADPGIAGQHQHPALAGERVLEQRAHLLELSLAPDEDAAGESLERVLVRGFGLPRPVGLGRRLERPARGRGAGRPIVGRLGEQLEHHPVERRRDLGAMARGGDGVGAQVLADDRHRVLARERRFAGEQLVDQRPERVEVRARVRAAAERLLGRQVGDRSDQHPLDRGS